MPLTLRPAPARGSFRPLDAAVEPGRTAHCRAPATAASARNGHQRSSGSVGRSRYDRYSPTPAGEENERPSRPRPARLPVGDHGRARRGAGIGQLLDAVVRRVRLCEYLQVGTPRERGEFFQKFPGKCTPF